MNAQSTYYISSEGDDNNSGLTPQSSWKSLQKYTAGNTYLLRCGDTFNLFIPKINNKSHQSTIISSYGKGGRPVISGYTYLDNQNWQKISANVWKAELKNKVQNKSSLSYSNIGFLKVNNKIYGHRKFTIKDLKTNWDFYVELGYVYIYLNSNPELSSGIQFASNNTLVHLSNNLTIQNLHLQGTGAHAIQGKNIENATIRNIHIDEIGGSVLGNKNKGNRYGNGIEFFDGAKNCVVEQCTVNDVYDAAFTMQGRGVNTSFENIIFRDNKCDRNEQSFEIWIKGGRSGFVNCLFERNECTNAGYGWSHLVRPNRQVAVHILVYAWEVNSAGLEIKDNIFSRARSGYIYMKPYDKKAILFKSSNNKIALDKNMPIDPQVRFSIDNAKYYFDSIELEKNSQFSQL